MTNMLFYEVRIKILKDHGPLLCLYIVGSEDEMKRLAGLHKAESFVSVSEEEVLKRLEPSVGPMQFSLMRDEFEKSRTYLILDPTYYWGEKKVPQL